ncbi:hypothetical protein SDC9_21917 [bioreactor metagenome]|uniref:PKD domain-containing protein n=1 Tax=bioreactor metagenome TaxID=1076179 RepID=A0A644UB62_9ZZZZ
MKKIKNLILLLLLFMTGIMYSYSQQPYIVLSGHVLNQQTGEPVVNQPVFISVDSMNYPGYFNEVITDGVGYYSDNLPYIYGGTPGSVTVTTADCNGIMISRSAALLPGMQQLVLDFNICGNMGTGCTALFRYMPGSNDMLTVSFFDESYPAPGVIINNWFWDFGDGNTSSAQNPVHTYSEPGLYNACLYISSNDSSCNSSFCMPVDAGSINPGGCENYFWYLPDSSGTGYTFEGFVMNGEAESYIWDFGDGTTANGQTVFHQFADTNMVHNVCLTTTSILNGDVCTSVSCQEVFSYFPSPCESYFWYYPDSTGTGYTFEGYTMGSQVESWTWDFGDGTTATGQSVTHTFANPNEIYTVCLTTTGTGPDNEPCTYTSCQEVFIYLPSPCESYFWYYPDSTGTGYTFEGYTMGSQVESWTWDFGDGTTATGQSVTHTFANPNEIYTVCLTTTGTGPDNEPCTYTSCQEVFIYLPSPCESYFWYYPDSTGTGYTFEGWAMNGQSNNQIESWIWDFGDGTTASGQVVSHSFSDPSQVYTVCLTTTGKGPDGVTCSYISCQEVFFEIPSPCDNYFEAVTNDGNTYLFTGHLVSGGQADYFWDFGEGSTATGQQVSHTFQFAWGMVYNVCLTTVSANPADSCTGVSCQAIFPGGGGNCEAVMSAVPDTSGYTYYFADLSQGNHSFRLWDFGDGQQSFEANPVHTYTAPGIYWACLTISDSLNNCWDQTCQEIWVDINQPGCQASFFAYPADSTNSSLTYQFINTSAPGFTNQQWSFGDGTVSIEFSPIHTYTTGGIYTACLTIWDSTNLCQSSFCIEIFAGNFAGESSISGSVIAGNAPAQSGEVWLIGATNYYFAQSQVDSGGIYNFGGVPAGSYYIYAMLTPDDPAFFNYLPTYYTSSLTWQGATIVTTGEPNGWYPVNLVSVASWAQGTGSISGTINWSGNFKSGGNPAANVEIVLFNSTGLPVAYTFSNSDGTFTFSNLPFGEYTVHAEMAGKTTQVMVVMLSDETAQASVNFVVSANEISALGLDENNLLKSGTGNVYPNPVGEMLYLDVNAPVSGTVMISITDLRGRIIYSESFAMSGNFNRIAVNSSALVKGVYVIQIKSEGYLPVQRKFIKQ